MGDYSDWELVDDNPTSPTQPSAPAGKYAGWEAVQSVPNSMENHPQETLGESARKAIPRIGEDIYRGGMNAIQSIPGYWEKAKTEVPALVLPSPQMFSHPIHKLGQAFAGANEGINSLAQFPLNLAKYATDRLHLLPQGATNAIQRITPEDTTQAINQLFGEPQYAGEAALRGVARNIPSIYGAGIGEPFLNPMNLTAGNIARNVVNEQGRQIAIHSRMYNNLWRDAQRAGIYNVPINRNLVNTNLDFIRQYKSPREYRTLEYFATHPTLSNAQSAVSDLRNMIRRLDEKSRTTSLTGEERNLYDALQHTQTHIENNMFLNPNGTINQRLADRYRNISHSYRENVVPYRYNSDIQAYINRELTPKELVNRLSHGEFSARKGNLHPAIRIRNNLKPILTGAGFLGGGAWLYNQMFGNKPDDNK